MYMHYQDILSEDWPYMLMQLVFCVPSHSLTSDYIMQTIGETMILKEMQRSQAAAEFRILDFTGLKPSIKHK